MGLMRKTVKIASFGLAPIHYRDKEERIILPWADPVDWWTR
jgi:hypothetical protein